jgi:hypothetical protein
MADNLTPAVVVAPTATAVDVDLGANPAQATGVEVSGTTVTITRPGHYRLFGNWVGQVVVATKDGVTDLTLDGATITSPVPGALVVTAADRVGLHLADGSVNQLADAGPATAAEADAAEADEDAPEAALFSRGDLVIDGQGRLDVAGFEDGIASTDGLVLAGGDLTVTAGDDAVRGKDYLVVSGGSLTAAAGGDALKSTSDAEEAAGYVWISGGVVQATAATDGIDAMTDALISGGELNLSCGDDGIHAEVLAVLDGGTTTIGQSVEGLEAPVIHIAGGTLTITASDDGINAAGGDGTGEARPDDFGGLGPNGSPGADPNAEGGMPNPGAWPSGQAGRPGRGGGFGGVEPGSDVPSDWPSGAPGGFGGVEPGSDVPGEWTGGAPGGFGGGGMEAGGDQILLISGGVIQINAEGDGVDSNGTGAMTGGEVTVYGPVRSGNGALDVASGLVVSGGTLIALDGGGMYQTPDDTSTQAWLFASFTSVVENTSLFIQSATGDVVTIVTPKRASTLAYSAANLEVGQSYTISDGTTTLATVTARN